MFSFPPPCLCLVCFLCEFISRLGGESSRLSPTGRLTHLELILSQSPTPAIRLISLVNVSFFTNLLLGACSCCPACSFSIVFLLPPAPLGFCHKPLTVNKPFLQLQQVVWVCFGVKINVSRFVTILRIKPCVGGGSSACWELG